MHRISEKNLSRRTNESGWPWHAEKELGSENVVNTIVKVRQPLFWSDPSYALSESRAKDCARLVMFVEAGIANMEGLSQIIALHSLLEQWAKFEQRFLQP